MKSGVLISPSAAAAAASETSPKIESTFTAVEGASPPGGEEVGVCLPWEEKFAEICLCLQKLKWILLHGFRNQNLAPKWSNTFWVLKKSLLDASLSPYPFHVCCKLCSFNSVCGYERKLCCLGCQSGIAEA